MKKLILAAIMVGIIACTFGCSVPKGFVVARYKWTPFASTEGKPVGKLILNLNKERIKLSRAHWENGK